MNCENNASVRRYINKLNRPLRHLCQADREDIVCEIKGHILERWEIDSKGNFDEESLKGVFGKMGTPEMIASQYCEQRGWARPQKSHALRNSLIAIVALILVSAFGISYFGFKYVVLPIIGLVSGKGEILEINDDGIKVMGGKVLSITDKGIKIGGAIDVSGDTGEIRDIEGGSSDKLKWLAGSKMYKEEGDRIVIPKAGLGNFELENVNGSIDVHGDDTDAISIEYTKKAYGLDLKNIEAIFAKMRLDKAIKGKTAYVKSEMPDDISEDVTYFEIDMNIIVPNGIASAIASKNGKIKISDIKGGVKVSAKNGSVSASGIVGYVIVTSKNGKIEANDIKGNVSLDSTNGALSVSDVVGDVNIETTNGSIGVEKISGGLVAKTVNGSTDVDDVSGDIKIMTKLGRIGLKQIGSGFTMDAETALGSVDCDFPTEKVGKKATAVVGDGKRKVELSTKMGSIMVRK